MEIKQKNQLLSSWLSFTHIQMKITDELESVLQQNHQLSLKEFYVLLFLSEAPAKKLKLQQLQRMVGLSQSAMSRLVSRFEAKGCGALKRDICTDDRRAIYTSLTKEGEEKLQRALASFNKTLAEALSEGNRQEELRGLIDQLTSNK